MLITDSGSSNNVVAGNFVGLNAAGSTALPNGGVGVVIQAGASGNRLGSDGDGVNDAGERNVISGNNSTGVVVNGGNANLIAGNYVGLDAGGTVGMRNQGQGIVVVGAATNTVIGLPAAGNVVSASLWEGITISDVGTNNTIIQSNRVGTNAAGTGVITPTQTGIWVRYGPVGTRIGTDGDGVNDAAEGNLISGNYTAVLVTTANWDGTLPANGVLVQGTRVAGNLIGTDVTGTTALGNQGDGILVFSKAANTTIGGPTAASRNIISGNQGRGIHIADASTVGTQVLGNYVGTNITGTAPLPNGNEGIIVRNAAVATEIGAAQAELLVSDWGNNRLKQFQPGIATNDQLTSVNLGPLGIAIAPNGYRFVVSQNGTLWRFNPAGVLVNTIATGLGDTRNLAIGPDGNIYVAVHNTNQILRFNGTTFASMGTFLSGLNGPAGLNFGPDGNLYVTETDYSSNGRLLKFDGVTGAPLGQVGTLNLRWASSPVWDAAGNIYLTERNGNSLLKLNGTTAL